MNTKNKKRDFERAQAEYWTTIELQDNELEEESISEYYREEAIEAALWRDLGLDLNADYDSPSCVDDFDFNF